MAATAAACFVGENLNSALLCIREILIKLDEGGKKRRVSSQETFFIPEYLLPHLKGQSKRDLIVFFTYTNGYTSPLDKYEPFLILNCSNTSTI
jgi:hypothetical protein